MNYEKRFNAIVEKIGDREKVEGIDRVYKGYNEYFAIKVKGLEIIRGGSGELSGIEFYGESYWFKINYLSQVIGDWFDYVEEKIDKSK